MSLKIDVKKAEEIIALIRASLNGIYGSNNLISIRLPQKAVEFVVSSLQSLLELAGFQESKSTVKELIDKICVQHDLPNGVLVALQLAHIHEIEKVRGQIHLMDDQKIIKWIQSIELPPEKQDGLSPSLWVYDVGKDLMSIGWYDYQIGQFSYIGEEEMFVTHYAYFQKPDAHNIGGVSKSKNRPINFN